MKRFLSILLSLVLALPLSGQSSLNCSGGCGGTGNATVVFENPGGRCTTESGVAVSTSDRTSQGTLYYTPWLHNNIVTYSGAAWQAKVFAQISLSLSITTGKNYDVFVNAAADTLSLSSAWTNDTTRADALGTQDSVQVLSSDHTKLWLCTIRATGTNIIEDSRTHRFVWNAYNQVVQLGYAYAGSSAHTYNSTWRAYNNDTTLGTTRCDFVIGATMRTLYLSVQGNTYSTTAGQLTRLALGVDTTTDANSINAQFQTYFDRILYVPNFTAPAASLVPGYHYVQIVEQVDTGTGNYDFALGEYTFMN